jgi:hypothetical protein
VLLGIALILAVCWLACRMKDDDIETPILTVRRGSKRKQSEEEREHRGADRGRREGELVPDVDADHHQQPQSL